MKVIKRNGSEVDFDITKIQAAIEKANKAAIRQELTQEQIQEISEYIDFKCSRMNRAVPWKRCRTWLRTRLCPRALSM